MARTPLRNVLSSAETTGTDCTMGHLNLCNRANNGRINEHCKFVTSVQNKFEPRILCVNSAVIIDKVFWASFWKLHNSGIVPVKESQLNPVAFRRQDI